MVSLIFVVSRPKSLLVIIYAKLEEQTGLTGILTMKEEDNFLLGLENGRLKVLNLHGTRQVWENGHLENRT